MSAYDGSALLNEMDMGIFGEEIHMKQRLITLIVAILGLTVGLGKHQTSMPAQRIASLKPLILLKAPT